MMTKTDAEYHSKQHTSKSSTVLKGESHRIYWQQWISSSPRNNNDYDNESGALAPKQCELITSSAAIRISPEGATAADVTQLIRKTLNLTILPATAVPSSDSAGSSAYTSSSARPQREPDDALVLVGTLYSDFVRFPHQQTSGAFSVARRQRQQQQRNISPLVADVHNTSSGSLDLGNNNSPSRRKVITAPAEPFHVVKTLHPTENPLVVHNEMEQHLAKLYKKNNEAIGSGNDHSKHDGKISPKLQWYFCPAATERSSSLIPNYVELDGYSTSMEHEADDDQETEGSDADDNSICSDPQIQGDDCSENDAQDEIRNKKSLQHQELSLDDSIFSQFPWLQKQSPSLIDAEDQCRRFRRRVRKSERESQILFNEKSALPASLCRTGFLLKRSKNDPAVWRRVYCVLTDLHFWFVTRIYTSNTTTASQSDSGECHYPFTKYGRVRLSSAILLEPTTTDSTANNPAIGNSGAFEIVAESGCTHVFRAVCQQQQRKWMRAISDRIVESYENDMLGSADMLIEDQSVASSLRAAKLAAEPMADAIAKAVATHSTKHDKGSNPTEKLIHALRNDHKNAETVLRWGIEVAEYRECCRYIRSILPPKSPVVMLTPPSRQDAQSSLRASEENGETSVSSRNCHSKKEPVGILGPEPLDPVIRDMMSTTWKHAATLLSRAKECVASLQDGRIKKPAALSSSRLETLCQHVDFIITGSFRPQLVTTTVDREESTKRHKHKGDENGRNIHDQDDLPPADLFDTLLAELQSLAISADYPSST